MILTLSRRQAPSVARARPRPRGHDPAAWRTWVADTIAVWAGIPTSDAPLADQIREGRRVRVEYDTADLADQIREGRRVRVEYDTATGDLRWAVLRRGHGLPRVGPGRPPSGRSIIWAVRVSPEADQLARSAADGAGLSLAAWVDRTIRTTCRDKL